MSITWKTFRCSKVFEYQLYTHLEINPGRGTLQDPSRFKDNAKKFLESEVKKLPLRPLRTLTLKTIPQVPRPTELTAHVQLICAIAKSSPNLLDHVTCPPMVASIKIAAVAPHSRNRFQARLTKVKIVPALPKKAGVQPISSPWDQIFNAFVIILWGGVS